MSIEKKDVLYISKLANIALSDEESVNLTKDINNIVKMVEKINEVDTEGIEPLSTVQEISNVKREDTPQPSLDIEITRKLAPKFDNGHIVVPSVID